MKFKYTFLLLVFCSSIFSQSSIVFIDNDFEVALKRAKDEGKDIFIDTYAPWCGPCKKMDVVFRDAKLANFFNSNFINVKINVDKLEGKEVATRYDIVFLPTMLFVNPDGYVKHRVDGLVNPKELLNIGDVVVNPQNYVIHQSTETKTTETDDELSGLGVVDQLTQNGNISTEDIESDEGEKILYILNAKAGSSNPEYLYHEAYFRIQQMDGSHHKIASQYLETQEDWSTEKNMRFIYSFLNKVDSDAFEYFVEEKASFEKMFGAEEYRKTLEILINKALYRQFPRPDITAVRGLFDLIYPRKSERYTYHYMLERYEAEENYEAFVNLGEEYLESLIKQDPSLLHKLGKYKCINADKKVLKECVYRVEQSIKLTEHPSPDQYFTLAQLYHKSNKKKKAIEFAKQAKDLSDEENELKIEIIDFLLEIQEL